MTEEEKAKELFYNGHRHCDWGSWDFGIEIFTEALKIKPDYIEVLFWRAQAYQFRDDGKCDYDKAIADYTAVLEIDANYKEARTYLAYAYYKNGNNEEAITQWKKALQSEPSIALKYMPDEFKTVEMCIEAVKQDGEALKFTPQSLKSEVQAVIDRWKAGEVV